MTEVVAVVELPGCTETTLFKEFELDAPVTPDLMRALAGTDSLSYYPHFPRPYFRIERKHAYVLQGVIGNRTFRATLFGDDVEGEEQRLRDAVSDFSAQE